MDEKAAIETLLFFDQMSKADVEQLATISKLIDFQEGDVIFRQGEPATTLHLLISGNVALEICASGVGCKKILTLGSGELLGWSPALQQEKLTATARAITDTQTLQISGAQLLVLCEQHPRFGYEFMKRAALALAKRLSATRMQLLDVYGSQMPSAAD